MADSGRDASAGGIVAVCVGGLEPTRVSERSATMDAIRGIAVLGILVMNIPGFALPESDFFNPWVGGYEGVDRAVWWFGRLFFEMKMQSLFSMLFGAGLVVLGERAARAGRRLTPVFYRRVGVLAVLGLLHAYLLWYGDILWTYAVCGAVIYPLRRLSSRWLLGVGVGLFLIGAVASSGVGAGLGFVRSTAERADAVVAAGGTPDEMEAEMRETWAELREDFDPTAEDLAEEARANRGTFVEVVARRAPGALGLQIGIPFWMFSFWRFTGYMLIGVVMMRWGVFSGGLAGRAYAWMMAAGYAVGLPIVAAGGLQADASGFDFVLTFLTGWQWNYIGSLFVAFGHVGALMLVFRSPVMGWIVPGLSAVGRMALSNYLLQSVLCAALFFGWGFGLWGRLTRTELAAVVVAIWVVEVAWSVWWLSRRRHGPAEWAWRRLTYGAAGGAGR